MAASSAYNHADDLSQNHTRLLVRDDIQEYVRKVYPLFERLTERHRAEGGLVPAVDLTNAYFQTSRQSRLFSLYRLRMQADLVAQQPKKTNVNACVRASSSACLPHLYSNQWTKLNAKAQNDIQKAFDRKMRAGNIVVGLVAQFDTGILLTCTPKVHLITTCSRAKSPGPLCEVALEQHNYVSRISGMLKPLADAILEGIQLPAVPSLDQICHGIQSSTSFEGTKPSGRTQQCSKWMEEDPPPPYP
ncbi:hypothetical protein GQ44DRAFT_778854 [Phaeosphaeriaceae sp. PMI808]|nr:hypothetical protein GQ44DRAFT_778854 [Phaeosphaeriaceae sp. PMI808]